MSRGTAIVGVVVCALLVATGSAGAGPLDELPPDAHPGPLHYVALGDSFTSGEGAPVRPSPEDEAVERYIDPTGRTIGWLGDTGLNGCHRSAAAYPVRVWEGLDAEDGNWGVSFRACSGARTDAVTGPFKGEPAQITGFDEGEPGAGADLVTIGFGGNDLGFGPIVQDCVGEGFVEANAGVVLPAEAEIPLGLARYYDYCRNKYDDRIADDVVALRFRLEQVIDRAKESLEPGGKVIVVGYPRVFPDVPPAYCATGAGREGGVDRDTMRWLNEGVAGPLNEAIAYEAWAGGVSFVDTSDYLSRFGRHDACVESGADRWINRVIPSDAQQSFHPKSPYHERVAEAVLDCMRTCPAAVPRRGNNV